MQPMTKQEVLQGALALNGEDKKKRSPNQTIWKRS
jgi:hypothetical protein